MDAPPRRRGGASFPSPHSGAFQLLPKRPLAILAGMKQLVLTLCLALACTTALAEKVYKVIQPDGSVLFTDSPPPDENAEPVDIPPINTTPPLASPRDAFDDSPAAEPQQAYAEFKITSPENDASFWDTGGNVSVELSLEPSLRPGDKIDVLLDGESAGGGRSTAITLTEMDRGTHNIQALVKDSAGKVLARSNTVTFTLQKGSLNAPQRPRAVPF